MAKYAAASIVLSLSVGLCACATRHAEEPTDTELAYQARDANCHKVIDYKITQREPRNFTVGYQAKMVVGEFAAGDTFYVKYQGSALSSRATRPVLFFFGYGRCPRLEIGHCYSSRYSCKLTIGRCPGSEGRSRCTLRSIEVTARGLEVSMGCDGRHGADALRTLGEIRERVPTSHARARTARPS